MPGRLLLLLCFFFARPASAFNDVATNGKNYPLIPDYSPVEGVKISLETSLSRSKHGDANELVSGFAWQMADIGDETLDWGLSFGVSREMTEAGSTVYNPSGSAALSLTPNDALTLAANAHFAARENQALLQSWSLEAGYRWAERWALVAKTYGQAYENPARQLGFTYAFSSGRAEIDLLYGQQAGEDQTMRWSSLGLRLCW